MPADSGSVPCSCGGVYTTGDGVRGHAKYLKKKTRNEKEAAYFETARSLGRQSEYRVYIHLAPDTYVIHTLFI